MFFKAPMIAGLTAMLALTACGNTFGGSTTAVSHPAPMVTQTVYPSVALDNGQRVQVVGITDRTLCGQDVNAYFEFHQMAADGQYVPGNATSVARARTCGQLMPSLIGVGQAVVTGQATKYLADKLVMPTMPTPPKK